MLTDIPSPVCPVPRYTCRALPAYRHVPGRHPHPVSNPQGHSYNAAGHHPTAGRLLPPERWSDMDDYLYGVDLYNQWYWWEAHEAWEGIWQQSDKSGVQGRFLQGLIQVSASHLKRHMQQAEGVRRLLARGREHLCYAEQTARSTGRFMGLDLPEFLTRVTAHSEQGTEYPWIVLQADAEKAL